MRWMTLLLVLVVAAAGCAPRAAQQGAASPAAGQVGDLGGRTIRVATDATYPPFEMLDDKRTSSDLTST